MTIGDVFQSGLHESLACLFAPPNQNQNSHTSPRVELSGGIRWCQKYGRLFGNKMSSVGAATLTSFDPALLLFIGVIAVTVIIRVI